MPGKWKTDHKGKGLTAKEFCQGVSTSLVTEALEKAIKDGSNTLPWRKSWTCEPPQNGYSGRPYNGINWLLCMLLPYGSPYYYTYNEIENLGGNVKKGEHSWPIMFSKPIPKKDKKTKEETGKMFFLWRCYDVFNLEQTEGIEPPKRSQQTAEFKPIEAAEQLVKDMPNAPSIKIGLRPEYSKATDTVKIPEPTSFDCEGEYYVSLFHELAHSTGHTDRLNRSELMASKSFGSDKYCKEELVAEIAATFMACHCGIEADTFDNSVAYLKGWLKALKNDNTLLLSAATRAKGAYQYIINEHYSQRKDDELNQKAA
jgi:antirestriction protein ArdC